MEESCNSFDQLINWEISLHLQQGVKFYVPVETLSTQDNTEPLKQ